MVIDPGISGNSAPELKLFRGQRGVVGRKHRINPAPADPDYDSLAYQFIVPHRDKDTQVGGYAYPNDPDLYIDYASANEQNNGPPVYS